VKISHLRLLPSVRSVVGRSYLNGCHHTNTRPPTTPTNSHSFLQASTMKFLISFTAYLLSVGLTHASPAAPLAKRVVSTDGSCGGTKGFTCQGSSFGNCCSTYGWCGSSTDHCSTGCNSAFGSCTGSGTTSKPTSTVARTSSTRAASSPASTSTNKVSPDASCGGTSGYTCLGSTFGNCCSANGWCGSTTAYVSHPCCKPVKMPEDYRATFKEVHRLTLGSAAVDVNQVSETAVATPAQDQVLSNRAAPARLLCRCHRQLHLDLR
jgi:hypothetical protein